MREIPLGRSGLVALVDDDDFPQVSAYTWVRTTSGGGGRVSYARRRWWEGGVYRGQLMHNMILGVVGVDHADHDGLNNQRSNLRPATLSQNGANGRKQTRGTTSRYKGVRLRGDGRPRPWLAQIMADGAQSHLGSYLTEEEAARAYDAAAVSRFGEFALINFPAEWFPHTPSTRGC